jgi:hypothetical protein
MKQSELSNWPVGGEIGNLIRAYDWSATSLGPILGWPQSLKAAIDILLHLPMPAVLLWHMDGIMIYNDAYAVFVGALHPKLLGAKMLEASPTYAEFSANVLRTCLGGGSLSYLDQEFTVNLNGEAKQNRFYLTQALLQDQEAVFNAKHPTDDQETGF